MNATEIFRKKKGKKEIRKIAIEIKQGWNVDVYILLPVPVFDDLKTFEPANILKKD